MPKRSKFTRMPKAEDLIPLLRECGLGLHTLPTYYALMDHANNKTGRCWPSVGRLAEITGLCRRTVERHIKALVSVGLVHSGGQGRGKRGRFSGCRYVIAAVLFFASATVRHQGRTGKRAYIKRRTKPLLNPKKETKEKAENLEEKRRQEAERRSAGYEWFFQ